jgi:pimeloyl-ACP methyl ester carboxylesterase
MMPRITALFALALLPLIAAPELSPHPDPLIDASGRPITSVAQWTENRSELLRRFSEHLYGRPPVGFTANVTREVEESAAPAFDGLAERYRLVLRYGAAPTAGAIRVTGYLPAGNNALKGCFVLIVNRSRRIIDEAETSPSEFWPVRDLIARGYAAVAFHYGDVATDKPETAFSSGVFSAFGPIEKTRAPDSWGAIAAWAFGAGCVVDNLDAIPRLSGVPVALIGHSRGGKVALWCGAQNPRVALAISNDSGTAGAALARTTRGESIQQINRVFPHWFASNYHSYAGRTDELPFDQHQLIALVAPRRVYVASASEDANADPEAEFRACVWASPVFELHGLKGVGDPAFPAVGECRHEGAIGYHLRAGPHDLRREDWLHFLDYADSIPLKN